MQSERRICEAQRILRVRQRRRVVSKHSRGRHNEVISKLVYTDRAMDLDIIQADLMLRIDF